MKKLFLPKKSLIYRKSAAFLKQIPRRIKVFSVAPEDYQEHPPVICNSMPKSGTNLIIQIARTFPGLTHYDTFINAQPALTFRVRKAEKMNQLLTGILPGEVVGTHLFFNEESRLLLTKLNAVHFFLYRDLRDVAVSEAYYLTHMNWRHRMHKIYKELPDMDSRIMLAIKGLDGTNHNLEYPDISKRFSKYKPWLSCDGVLGVRFESLVSGDTAVSTQEMLRWYLRQLKSGNHNESRLVENAVNAINPHQSHTFRSGKAGGWRKYFTDKHRDAMKECAGDLLIELGYENDLCW